MSRVSTLTLLSACLIVALSMQTGPLHAQETAPAGLSSTAEEPPPKPKSRPKPKPKPKVEQKPAAVDVAASAAAKANEALAGD